MKRTTRAGALAALFGAVLVLVGLFLPFSRCGPGVPCPSPSWNALVAYLGLIVLVVGVAMLVWAGWRGSRLSWMLAAAASVPATWFVYEVARQNLCPMLTDPALSNACLTAYGTMTAPVLSFGVGGLLLVVGWLRLWAAHRVTSNNPD